MKKTAFWLAAASVMIYLGASAAAQTPPAPAAAPAAAPALAVEQQHGDWVVRCLDAQSIGPCDILHVALNRESGLRVLSISFAYLPHNDIYVLQMVLPLGVAIDKGATLAAGDQTLSGLAYSRCERDGCYIEIGVPPALVQALSTLGESTTITIYSYSPEAAISLPLALTGFAAAAAQMREQAIQRAVAPPAPAPAQ